MVEKNYDPDNENCPEKEMVENLHQLRSKSTSKNAQNAEEFIDDNSNRISKNGKDLNKNADADNQ